MRRKKPSEGSLDLLLDTITNTFGGVLFLAILVSLLLRHVGNKSNPQPPTDPLSEVELIEYQSKILQYQNDITSLQKLLSEIPQNDPDVFILNEELTDLLRDIQNVITDKAATLVEIVKLQQRITQNRRKISELPTKSDLAKQHLAAIQKTFESAQAESLILARAAIELEQKLNARTKEHEVERPILAPSTLPQVGLYLRYGRIYMMHEWDQDLVRRGPNPEHFFVENNGETQTATPRPAAGISVNSQNFQQMIKRWLSRFPTSDWVVVLVTFPDSFQEFQAVKAELIREGYKYQPYPTSTAVVDAGGKSMAQ
ncbi:MAG: hypothetical protein ACR2NF_08760 [Pirellulales bacterium]